MTIREFGRFIMVSFCKVMSMGFMFALIDRSSDVLYLMMIADFFFTLFAFFFIRVLMLMAYDHLRERAEFRKKCQNVLIYGVGEKSVSLISRLQNSEHYRAKGRINHPCYRRFGRVPKICGHGIAYGPVCGSGCNRRG
jgi:FlaA1/EpsC-like NDP-sugar epimerase